MARNSANPMWVRKKKEERRRKRKKGRVTPRRNEWDREKEG